VKDAAAQAGRIEVQTGLGDDVDQIDRQQPAQPRIKQIVGGFVIQRNTRG
jgi:hypothetical protein